MAVTALLKFTQGANTDVPGRAVIGDMTSGGVTVTNGDNTDVVSWEYELLYVPPGSAEPLNHQGPNATPSFSFGQPDVPGCYRVRLTVRDIAGNKDVDIRNFVVPFPNRGLIAPPYQGNPLPLPVVAPPATTPAPKPDEMNVAGQAFGWSGDDNSGRKLLYRLIKEVDAISGSSGTAGGDLTGTYPNPTVAKIQGRLVDSAAPSLNDVLTFDGTKWVPQAPSSSFTAGGDLTGTSSAQTVVQLTGSGGVLPVLARLQGLDTLPTPFCLGFSGTFVLTSDANATIPASEYQYPIVTIGSSVSLTATRNVNFPGTIGALWVVVNTTAGGQSIQVKTAGGSGVTIPNGKSAIVWADGTNIIDAVSKTTGTSGTAGGDLSGSYPNPTVAKVNGTTYPAGGALTTGQVPRVTGVSTVAYGPLDLANASAVTGTLPAGNQASQTMGGDVTGTTAASTVAKIQNRTVASTAPVGFQSLAWDNGTSSQFQPTYPVQPIAKVSRTLDGSSHDDTVFTVPASPTGNGTFVLTRVVIRLRTALTGTGNNVITAGSTVGGNDYITAQTVNSSTTTGIIAGVQVATLGTGFPDANGGEAILNAGAIISVRCAGSGTVTGGAVDMYVYGYFLP